MLFRLFSSEWLKFRKSNIWLLLFLSPAVSTVAGLTAEMDRNKFAAFSVYTVMIYAHAVLFMPILTGVFAAFVCRYEHQHNGWKQLLTLPSSRLSVYASKGLIVGLFLAIAQCLFFVGLYIVIKVRGYDALPQSLIFKSMIGGWLACLPLAALQMWISTMWSSFTAPLALNVVFTLPNLIVANSSTYGPWYPWVQPFLMMLSKQGDLGVLYVSASTMFVTVIGSFIVFQLFGMLYFRKKAI